jgi:hypothetical protein
MRAKSVTLTSTIAGCGTYSGVATSRFDLHMSSRAWLTDRRDVATVTRPTMRRARRPRHPVIAWT